MHTLPLVRCKSLRVCRALAQIFRSRVEAMCLRVLDLQDIPTLVKFSHLVHLDLSYCRFGIPGAEVLGSLFMATTCPSLLTLNLKENCLGPAGIRHLRALPTGLIDLDVGCNHLGTRGAMELGTMVGGLESLKRLSIYDNEIGGAGAYALLCYNSSPRWPNLEVLDISNNRIGAAGVSALETAATLWPQLRELYMGVNMIGARECEVVVRIAPTWRRLTMLDLSGNALDDAAAEGLATVSACWPDMREFIVGLNNIGPRGVAALLLSGGASWKRLEVFDVSRNVLGMDGLRVVSTEALMTHWPDLQEFHVWGNGIDWEARESLLPFLKAHWPKAKVV